MKRLLAIALLVLLVASVPAYAGNLLFVSDDDSDFNIPTALLVDGHTVTVSANRADLEGDLSAYCAVIWSASDDGEDNISAVITNLTSYVNGGGGVFVTGGDSVASPVNADMLGFVGGSNGLDSGNLMGPVANTMNSLAVGVVDIRGETPPNVSDADTLCEPLLAGTVSISTSDTAGCTGHAWTLRTIGSGEVAWVTSSNFDSQSNDPDWTDTTIPGDGVFNGGLRNFAYNSCLPPTSVPATNHWGLAAFMVLSGIGSVLFMRRKYSKI